MQALYRGRRSRGSVWEIDCFPVRLLSAADIPAIMESSVCLTDITEQCRTKQKDHISMKAKNRYLVLFTSLLVISAFTFGGGAVIIPLMRKKMVEELGWLSEEELLDMIAIAQSSPGAVSVNVAAQIGLRTAGIPGLMLAVIATVLPPSVWLILISIFYDSFRSSPAVDAILRSMQPVVAAVILCAALDIFNSIRHKQRTSGWLLFGAALALGLYGVNVIWILLGGGILGAGISAVGGKRYAA